MITTEFLPYRVARTRGGKVVSSNVRFGPSIEAVIVGVREDDQRYNNAFKDDGLLVEPCADPRKHADGTWKIGPNAGKRAAA